MKHLDGFDDLTESVIDMAQTEDGLAVENIIGIASGKGGVGKSTVAVNMAIALTQLGKDVAIMDCDVYGFSIPKILGIANKAPKVNKGKIEPIEAHGVKVLSMGNLVSEDTPIIWRGPMLGKMLRQFVSDVNWGAVEYLLLDLPPGTGDIALDVAHNMPKSFLIIVTTPEPLAASVATRAGNAALKINQSLLGVIENMSGFICPHCEKETKIFTGDGGTALASALDIPLLGKIPFDIYVQTATEIKKPSFFRTESIAIAYKAIAKRTINELSKLNCLERTD